MNYVIGDGVLVGDPMHRESEHMHCFIGSVIALYADNTVLIIDQDGTAFVVHIEDIEGLSFGDGEIFDQREQ